jgi:hypothetical protein
MQPTAEDPSIDIDPAAGTEAPRNEAIWREGQIPGSLSTVGRPCVVGFIAVAILGAMSIAFGLSVNGTTFVLLVVLVVAVTAGSVLWGWWGSSRRRGIAALYFSYYCIGGGSVVKAIEAGLSDASIPYERISTTHSKGDVVEERIELGGSVGPGHSIVVYVFGDVGDEEYTPVELRLSRKEPVLVSRLQGLVGNACQAARSASSADPDDWVVA